MRQLIEQVITSKGFEEREASESWTMIEVEKALATFFSRYFGAEFVAENFEIPADFKAYLMALPSCIHTQGWWVYLYGMDSVVGFTKSSMGMWIDEAEERRKNGNAYTTDTFWIAFGGWSDKHEFIICCDNKHPDFGKIYDAYDDHPYLNEDFLDDDIWDNIEDFLRHYVRVEDRDDWDT